MMNRQLAQLESSMGEMKGNSRKLPFTIHVPEKANVSKITLLSGTVYCGPQLKKPMGESSGTKVLSDTVLVEELKRPLPQMEEPFFLDEEPVEEGKTKEAPPRNECPEESMLKKQRRRNRFPIGL